MGNGSGVNCIALITGKAEIPDRVHTWHEALGGATVRSTKRRQVACLGSGSEGVPPAPQE